MKIQDIRDTFTLKSSSGAIYIDGQKFCESLEDVARADGVKIQDETCVPPCVCNVKISYSRRFKRDMLLLYNQPDGSIIAGGIRFTGIRVHGGNDRDDTAGCPLVAFNELSDDRIQGTAERKLFAKVAAAIERSELVTWEFINRPGGK